MGCIALGERWRPRPNDAASERNPKRPAFHRPTASLFGLVLAGAVGLAAAAGEAADRLISASLTAWPATLTFYSAETGGFISQADLPTHQAAVWTPISSDLVFGVSGSSGGATDFRDADGDRIPGVNASYSDWSLSLGRSFGWLSGIVVDGSAGFKQRNLTTRIPSADYRSAYSYGGLFLAAGATLPLTPRLSAIGQGMWGAMQTATLDEFDRGDRRRTDTGIGTFDYRVGGVLDLNPVASVEGGYRGAVVTEQWDDDWRNPARVTWDGPYVGARIRF